MKPGAGQSRWRRITYDEAILRGDGVRGDRGRVQRHRAVLRPGVACSGSGRGRRAAGTGDPRGGEGGGQGRRAQEVPGLQRADEGFQEVRRLHHAAREGAAPLRRDQAQPARAADPGADGDRAGLGQRGQSAQLRRRVGADVPPGATTSSSSSARTSTSPRRRARRWTRRSSRTTPTRS